MPKLRLSLLCGIILMLLVSACASSQPSPMDSGNLDKAFRELNAEEAKH